jgi:glycosyltransferase involved in cell wall biosynthesis
MEPKYSITIPAYNRPEYLEQAILWALGQTVSDFEIVVSDDCSTEDIAAMVRAFDDSRVRYYRSSERLGATKNHQRAVHLAKGQYVIALNSDDLMLPQCLQIGGRCLDQNPKAGAAYFSITYFCKGRVSGFQSIPNLLYADEKVLAAQPWLEKFHGTTPSCCLFRKEAFARINGYKTSLRFAYDWDFYMRMMRFGGGVSFLPEILGVYRRHEEQMVQQHSIDALLDILDLWNLPEYEHWRSEEIADLLITEVRTLQLQGKPTRIVFDEVRQRKLVWKIAAAIPHALWKRMTRGARKAATLIDEHYTSPKNSEAAITLANQLVERHRLFRSSR